jgi:hypothetical protein
MTFCLCNFYNPGGNLLVENVAKKADILLFKDAGNIPEE